jgi:Cof subfamily protein (haloacid dehalogenase superfamily)
VIRLICLDVDGTLVGTSGKVLPSVWDAARQVRSRRIRIAICSGRPAFGETREYARRLDEDGWHVFQNGASVVHLPTGRSLSSSLAPETIRMLIERARRTGRLLELYTDTDYAVENGTELAREHARLLGIAFAPRAFESLEGPIVRAQWLLTHEEARRAIAEPHPGLEVSPSTSPVMTETTFVMLTPTGVGKASGVRAVASAYDIPLTEVMLVGDGHNDIQAMAEVGFAVAMGNAATEVHQVARLHVGHVDEGGLIEALETALDL